MTKAPFDPWDWLGVCTGGFFSELDGMILLFLELLRDGQEPSVDSDWNRTNYQLVATLLCNTDAFEFDDDPMQLRFVGDERFTALDALIDAWDSWYVEHYK